MSAEPVQISVARAAMDSRDFDEVRELISRRYVQHLPRVVGDGRDFTFRSRSVSAGGLTVDQPIYRACVDFGTEPFESVLIVSVLDGRFSVADGRRHTQATAGESLLYPAGSPLDIVLDHSTQWVAQFPLQAVTRVAGHFGVAPGDFRFDAMSPVSAAAGRRWADTVTYLARLLAVPGETSIHPLLLSAAIETAATTAVTVFPNTTMTMSYVAEPDRVAPAAVRRAIAYVDEHAADPITLDDIARASGLSVRALQSCFRRYLDTTPVTYLRRVRLEQAHRDLLAADPTRGDTVAGIAYRWGFANLGRFAGQYRTVFGRRPSQTLHT